MSIPESIINGTNPTYLPPRYEIRQLTSDHDHWIRAVIVHSNLFHSPVWSKVYANNLIERTHQIMPNMDYLVQHSTESGMSYGIFDTEYKYKRAESAATQGKLYWDLNDKDSDGAALLEQMDFPLVSVAMAYDAINAIDMDRFKPLLEAMPLFANMHFGLLNADKRDPESWKAKGPGEVLMRNSTSTRPDYEGKGLMRQLAQWLMREAASKGYRGIQINCAHDAVTKVWLNPPKPFQGSLIATLDSKTYTEQDQEGRSFLPFSPSKQLFTTVYVKL